MTASVLEDGEETVEPDCSSVLKFCTTCRRLLIVNSPCCSRRGSACSLRVITNDDGIARLQFAGHDFRRAAVCNSKHHAPGFRFLLCIQDVNDAGTLNGSLRRNHLDLLGWIPLLSGRQRWGCGLATFRNLSVFLRICRRRRRRSSAP